MRITKPSKNLADQLSSMLQGNQEFIMIDDQKLVYEEALELAGKSSMRSRNVLIVEGGPGTGKSVVAVNLLVALTKRELVVQYVTRNSAPRTVYEAKLTGSFRKSHISNMFGPSGSFHSSEAATYDCLLVDEAHRLNAKSGFYENKGENQIKEIIRASKCRVFFIDENQRVTLKDIGEKEEIRRWARDQKATVSEMKLESQFRCNGSDDYLLWLDGVLEIQDSCGYQGEAIDYDFRILDSPSVLHELIREKNRERNKARVVAGYCWKWISKKSPRLKDIVIGVYKATWNLDKDGQGWLIMPDSVSEVGCIHTCQGLELDYIGVIIGPDLVVRDGRIKVDPSARAPEDKSIRGWKKRSREDSAGTQAKLEAIVKNTYRTLMTRGQRGCFVYCVDRETQEYFKNRLASFSTKQTDNVLQIRTVLPRPHESMLPLLHLRAVANAHYESTNGLFSDDGNFEWIPVQGGPYQKDRFLARIEGDSMEPQVPNGSLCLFRKDPGGSRNGKIVLCRIDSITGGGPLAVLKKYRSFREVTDDGIGEAEMIVLSSLNPAYPDIRISHGEGLEIVGIFERIMT